MRRVPTYYQDLEDIIGANQGHVIGSTACLGGFLPSLINKYKAAENEEEKDLILNRIHVFCDYMENKIFGKGNFFFELQPSDSEEQTYVNSFLITLSKELNIPYIITTDSHYLAKEDRPIHKAYLNAQNGDREVDAFYATTYMMDTEELESYLDLTENDLEVAYQNIKKIKDMCSDYDLQKSLKIPQLMWKKPESLIHPKAYYNKIPYLQTFVDSDYYGDNVLAQHIVDRLFWDETLQNQASYDAIEECLKMTWESSVVNKTHWSAYYLNLQKIIDVCWEAGSIVGPGRGSGVGFILLYVLGITQINPLRETTKTFAWRFLNPSRVSVLDVDFDIEGGRRPQVLAKFREVYGEDRVANVITFGTEKSKQAILTAARGLEMDNNDAQYISSLIPADRGITRTLHQCYYGDKENDYAPIALFVKEMNNNPELWEIAQKIEGLVCRMGIHAGGVIFVDEPFTNSTGLMRAPDGTIITAFDLHDCEAVSLIKYDALSVEAEDKIHICLDLLCDAGHIQRQNTLKETYESALGVYNLERDDPKMWEMVWNHKILSLFQMEKQSGIQGIALTKPKSVEDLAHLNSVIRLMAQEKGGEQPLQKFARFKHNINLWYQEMDKYGLTKEEQELLKPYLLGSYGICESQEGFMQLVQIPECGGFDLNWADRLRKSIAKKNPKEFDQLAKEYFARVEEQQLSKPLCSYVWNVLVSTSKGYGFNLSHTLAYSLVALQEMNLAFRYPIIYWNCACLITDSGSIEYDDIDIEDKEDQSTNYDKIAQAIGKMRDAGVEISLVNINESGYTFIPDEKNNKIWFGLKGLVNVGDEVVEQIIQNRPYLSVKDFYYRVKPKKNVMIALIKGGAFDSLMDRTECMIWYIWETCDKKSRLTLQNLPSLIKFGLLPARVEEEIMAYRVYEFNRYLKAMCKTKDGYYKLDERAINFLSEIDKTSLINSTENGSIYFMSEKSWDKVYQRWMDVFRDWIKSDKDNILMSLNNSIFQEDWCNYAKGSLSTWEMASVCFYYHEHELANVNRGMYGIVDFYSLPEDPVVAKTFSKGGKEIKIFKLSKICGTCIAKNKAKGTVSLLTTTGVVEVKFSKEYFSMFDKRISQVDAKGKKKVIEYSWFNRGSMILVQGMRSGDNFVAKKYASQGGHQLYKIDKLEDDGSLILRTERYTGDAEEDDSE